MNELDNISDAELERRANARLGHPKYSIRDILNAKFEMARRKLARDRAAAKFHYRCERETQETKAVIVTDED